jgi:hypothetical protein
MILQSPITAPFAEHELAAWRGMLELHAGVTHRLDAQMRADHGLTLSGYELLIRLDDAPAHRMRMAEIAERVLLSPSGATGLLTTSPISGTSRGERTTAMAAAYTPSLRHPDRRRSKSRG